ncbi:hypothetical protein THARTR1_10795 [Trichoderma harzianum]|uniref:Uncharacterized protein n=1 Tax=Trichoderma harzianum TaxID=5544 RepID=A0A2K0TLS5_TRIHA|nr:hypothetical protein THARTR1_10795 [Trichoderma harzianum]
MMKGERVLRIWKKLYGDFGVREEGEEEEKDERNGGDEAAVNEDKSTPRDTTMNPPMEKMPMEKEMVILASREDEDAPGTTAEGDDDTQNGSGS